MARGEAPGECFSCSDRRGNGIHGESLSYSVRAIVKRPSLLRVEVSCAFNARKREASLTEGICGKETKILENLSQEAKHLLRSRTGRSSVTEFACFKIIEMRNSITGTENARGIVSLKRCFIHLLFYFFFCVTFFLSLFHAICILS